jgi:hypothetical protein
VDTGYRFDGWLADFALPDQLANPLVVTMDKSRRLSAIITPVMRTLTLSTSGEGTGAVVAAPAAGSIENSVVSHYGNGTAVVLTAAANPGWVFQGWDGHVPQGAELLNPLTVTMDQDRVITAVFGAGAQLTLDIEGDGDVLVEPDLEWYAPGDSITLTAVPSPTSEFTGWSGAATGDHVEITLVLNASMAVTAHFTGADSHEPQEPPANGHTAKLIVDIQGDGVVTPAGGDFNIGAKVTLIATPGIGSSFVRWEEGAAGSDLVTTVAMDGNTTVLAVFEAEDPTGRPSEPTMPSTCGAMGMLGLPVIALLALAMVEPGVRRSLMRLARV